MLFGKVPTNDYKLECQDTLILFLIIEARKKKKSEFWPYIKTFPTSFETLLINFPAKYDQFLLDHVVELKYRTREIFKLSLGL
jgi:hypothetical protein